MSVYRPEIINLQPGSDHIVIAQFPARARLAVAANDAGEGLGMSNRAQQIPAPFAALTTNLSFNLGF